MTAQNPAPADQHAAGPHAQFDPAGADSAARVDAEREMVADLAPELEHAAQALAGAEEPDDAADDAPLPSFTEQLADQLGGVRGLVESGIPVLVFVVANIAWALRPAILVAAGSAVAIAVWRLTRKESVRHAINGLFGIGLGAIIAWKTGSAKNFYLPGILLSLAYGVAMLASIPLRVPLVGWVWALLADRGSSAWRGDRHLVRTFSWLTAVWAATYLVKTGVQAVIFSNTSDSDPGTTLGIARLVLGYPPYLLLIAVTVWVVRRYHPRAGQRGAEPTG